MIAQKRRELEPHDKADGLRRALLARLEAAERILLNPERRAKYDHDLDREKVNFPSQAPKVTSASNLSRAPVTTQIDQAQNAKYEDQPSFDGRSSCEICGASIEADLASCPICGAQRVVSKSQTLKSSMGSESATTLFEPPTKEFGKFEKLFRLLGWSHVRGTIIFADQPYHVEKEFILWKFLVKAAIFAAVAYGIYQWAMIHLSLIILVLIIFFVLSFLTGGLLATLLGQIFSMSMFMKSQPKDQQVQVRDVRLRDEQFQEYTVRFRGELHSGEAMVGDTVEIWGRNRGGTVVARWGYNFRTSSRIWVKYR